MDFSRPEINSIPPTSHGAPDYAELEKIGLDPDEVVDFSVNSNPFGPSLQVRDAISRTPLDRYPDRDCLALRRALAERLSISPEHIVVGNGTAELIWLAAFAFLQPGDDVLILGPTFGEYELSAQLMGAEVRQVNALPEAGFVMESELVSHELGSRNYRMVFLCNQNNPTGQVIPPNVICGWVEAHRQTLFIVDEAYLAFSPDLQTLIDPNIDNLLVLRSMTKDFALAGLRLGYAVGHERLIQTLASVRPAWNVNALAQSAGLAALQDDAYYQESLARLKEEKEFLVNGLRDLGFTPIPSQTHFFLLPVENGAKFRQNLLQEGIQVRDCASFGLSEYVRISPRCRKQNQSLLACLHLHKDYR